MTPDELADAGLYEPARHGTERLELLRWLVERGVTVEQLRSSDQAGRLEAAHADQVLARHQERLTLDEVAARAGVAPERVLAIWRASGFPEPPPDSRPFWEDDVTTIVAFEFGSAFVGDELTARFTRVMGSSLARIADAAVSMFLRNVEEPIVSTDEPWSLELAEAVTEGMTLLEQLPATVMDSMFRHHVEAAVRRGQLSWTHRDHTAVHAVGFVDLVDSSALAHDRDPTVLAMLLAEFEQLATDLVIARDGRVVKAIGDEVMYYTADVTGACEVASTLVARFGSHDRVGGARAGVDVGSVVWQDGDCYGAVVNLASRLVDLAEPGEVLAGPAVADALPPAGPVVAESVGSRSIKGFVDPVVVHRIVRR